MDDTLHHLLPWDIELIIDETVDEPEEEPEVQDCIIFILLFLAHERMVVESGETPTYILTWKNTVFISHILPRSHDDRFPIPLWETWFCQSLGVPIPVLFANPRQCPCRQFSFDHYGERVSVNLNHFQCTNGSYIGLVCCYTRLVTELKPIE